ncbi:hypothetical protein C1J03_04830 [Sulfitobacter sp. SK012]|uniref:hypothetical protein n=1 Tax=Sulfitobacter sp. SK012 TaxID=1389005 RepID=UPI000E0C374B|nr:hypothetical protein [Sulfitobacter sp. SK012]AXI45420.1 hypothetical protein C1J03_04830 [Sulfitobacter sp. SK012]
MCAYLKISLGSDVAVGKTGLKSKLSGADSSAPTMDTLLAASKAVETVAFDVASTQPDTVVSDLILIAADLERLARRISGLPPAKLCSDA